MCCASELAGHPNSFHAALCMSARKPQQHQKQRGKRLKSYLQKRIICNASVLYLNKKLVTFSRSTVAVFCAHDVRCEIEAALAFVLTEPRLCTPGPRARDPARSPRSQRGAQQHSRGGGQGRRTHALDGCIRAGTPVAMYQSCRARQGLRCCTPSAGWVARISAQVGTAACIRGSGCLYVRVCLLC